MNTQVVDTALILLAFLIGVLYSGILFRKQKASVKRLPLFLILTAGFWSLFNWIGHTVAVLAVNLKPIWDGSFTYSFHFYSLLLLGVVFMLLSSMQLNLVRLMSQGDFYHYTSLKRVSGLIIMLSLPIFPLNPIGLLPVISAVVILATVAFTRKSWVVAEQRQAVPAAQPTLA